ncbi:hypothetical protein N9W89_14330 [Hellea sp.]|nr:hypothetical protein [Hellea sp.]
MKKIVLGAAVVLIVGAAPMEVQAQDISVSTSIDFVSDYVFRGVSLAETAIQPGVEVSYGDFTVGAWYSTGVGEASVFAADEVDLYASYGFALTDKISASVGGTYFHFPQGGDLFETNGGSAGTYEVNAGVAFDVLLSPSAMAYYDFTLSAFTLEGSVAHSFATSDKTSLDLGLTAGLVTASDDNFDADWQYGTASAALGYAFTDDVSTYVGVNYTLSNSDDEGLGLDFVDLLSGDPQSDLFWAGVGVAAGF